MGKYTSKIFSAMLVLMFVNSLVFYQLNMPEEQQLSDFLDYSSTSNRNIIDNKGNNFDDRKTDNRIRQELIEGNFLTKAFFAYDTWSPSLDEHGPGYQWVEYDDLPGPGHDASATLNKRYTWSTNGDSLEPLNFFPSNDAYILGKGRYAPHYNSTMFSPVFNQEYTIDGKVYYLINIHRDFNELPGKDDIQVTFRVKLWHFNSSTSLSTEITSLEYIIPDAGGGEYFTDFTLDSTIPAPTIIPAGDRLKVTYEAKVDNITKNGHLSIQIASEGGTYVNWDIVDGIYSNSYTLNGIGQTLGVQLYMRSNEYPDIDLFNAINNTVYQVAQGMTIDVTDGSVSKYRWDGGTWNSFSDSTLTALPASHDWHELEVVASDPVYNNTQITYYQIGYDASITNIELHAPYSNGSYVDSGSLLNFSAYYVDTVTYEWDASGTQFPLTDPYDIVVPTFEEEHNLTIRTTDYYTSDTFIYFFSFDSDLPTIQLYNVVNDTSYAPLKTIDVEIFDATGIKNVKYHWESESNSTWIPEYGSIYRTNLPVFSGFHWLYVYAFDNYDHSSSKVYQFYTDDTFFLVELQELTNDSYYQGGETVKITIQKSNGTVKYVWDSGTIEAGSLSDSTLTLEGTEGIPLTAGPHNLTIITFDTTNAQFVYYFNFIVDIEAPIIDSSIIGYNNSRYRTNTDFVFIITDNYVSGSDLTVLISVDGKANKTLSSPYELDLAFFEDGDHYFYLYAIDIAGNADIKYIFFIIDTTAPTYDVIIVGIVEHSGQYFVPGNVEVIIENLVDDDPSITMYYSWPLFLPFNSFTDSFFLPDINQGGTLTIWIQDSFMSNVNIYSIDLIIDVDSPVVNLLTYDNETTNINFDTYLYFETEDYADNTIKLIEYMWDKQGFLFTSPVIDFNQKVKPIYAHDSTAKFFVYVEDIAGNSFTYTFSFIIDTRAPIIDLNIYDASEDEWVDLSEIYYVQSNTEIVYNDSINDDLLLFQYTWNWTGNNEDWIPLNASVSWSIYTPETDGSYNLTIFLTDNTVGTPNTIFQEFGFLVDNIILNFSATGDFLETTAASVNSTDLIYGDNVSYELTVTDAIFGLEIVGLQNRIVKNENLNISVEVNKLSDNITYEIFILATNVTLEMPTKIEIQFFKYNESKQLIWIFLNINKQDGDLIIDSRGAHKVTFEEDFTIVVNLDNDIGENETIIIITVNGTVEIYDFIALSDGFFQFNYSSILLNGKGNYTLFIYVESNFFKASETVDVEVDPIEAQITIEISEFEVIEGAQLVITGYLTMTNGTPITLAEIIITLYIIDRENGKLVFAFDAAEYDRIEIITETTDFDGYFTAVYQMTDEINYIDIEASYEGNNIFGVTASVLEEPVYSIPPPGLPSWLLYIIIGGSLVLALIVSIVVYKLTRRKPFLQFLEEISEEEIENNYSIMSPGVVLSIFDQKKGPVPLVMDHSLKAEKYSLRLRMGTENFILKISDQAYSSLGFEEHDVGRRVGSIVLPGEKMVGWVHGIQLPNKAARGGFENLSLIVLADTEFGSYLLNYQEYLYDEADLLSSSLKSKKELTAVNEILTKIRKKSVKIMLAAQRMEG